MQIPNLDVALITVIGIVDAAIQIQSDYLTSTYIPAHEDYIKRFGSLSALKELRLRFEDLAKQRQKEEE